MKNVIIRKFNRLDIDKVREIGLTVKEFEVVEGEAVFWTKEQLERWVDSEKDVLLLAENEQKEVLGFVMFANHLPTGKSTFENAWAREDKRGSGLFQEMLELAT